MAFDPARIDEDTCGGGHLDSDPIYDVLLAIDGARATGRLTIEDATGPNHMFFMQGKPVGVQLSEHFHPLGQLLLELGRIDGATFVAAQRLIAAGNRLPGQVYKELQVVDDDSLKEVLSIQARLKAEHFCRLGSRPFTFCRGLTFLTGFNSTPLDIHCVIFLAVRQQMLPEARAAWIDAGKDKEVHLKSEEGELLPARLSAYGFGPPEERFLQRILAGWERVGELAETGTLPRDEMAVLLRYLEIVDRLEMRKKPAPPEAAELAVPSYVDDVFSSSKPRKRPEGLRSSSSPAPITALSARPALEERTEPRPAAPRRRDIHDVPTVPTGEVSSARPAQAVAPPEEVALGDPAPPRPPATAEKSMPQFRSVLLHEETPAEPEPPPPKKKKVRRTTPLPSSGTGPMVTETRKEKTAITPMPTIVIADEDG